MIAPSARRTAVLAAAVITGAAASAFGQQMAHLDEEGLKSHLRTECPRGGDACEIPAAKKFFDALTEQRLRAAAEANKRAAEADKRAAEADKRTAGHQKATADHNKAAAEHRAAADALAIQRQCVNDITAALKATPPRTTAAAVKAAQAAAPNDPCAWATTLGVRSNRHGALTKQ